MKKIALALTLVSALLFSLVAEIQLVAALAWSHEPPAGPPFVSPTVSVISPQNDTTYSGNVPLIFNMTPGGFPPGDPYSDRGPWGYGYFYSLDGEDFVWIAEETNTTLYWLSPGNHCILLRLGYMMSRSGFCVDAEPVYFNVVEPFPTTLVIAIGLLVIIATIALVVVICAKLLVYYRKQQPVSKEKKQNTT